jgi:protein ImuA
MRTYESILSFMQTLSAPPSSVPLAALRAELDAALRPRGPVLEFGVPALDARLAGGGLARGGLHEVAAASPSLADDAAATLFAAGIAARFAETRPGQTVLWALTRFDLYAPGLEQVGLGPQTVLYAQGRNDAEVLALAEDGLRGRALACVVTEAREANRTATRRLQLAAAEGDTPLLLYRRRRKRDACPFAVPSAAMTRWRIGCVPSAPLDVPGLGRARWAVELVRQRGGNPFSLILEACDEAGRLALPAATADRAAAEGRAPPRAA